MNCDINGQTVVELSNECLMQLSHARLTFNLPWHFPLPWIEVECSAVHFIFYSFRVLSVFIWHMGKIRPTLASTSMGRCHPKSVLGYNRPLNNLNVFLCYLLRPVIIISNLGLLSYFEDERWTKRFVNESLLRSSICYQWELETIIQSSNS